MALSWARTVLALAVAAALPLTLGMLTGGVAGAQPAAGGVVGFGSASSYGAPTASGLAGPVTGVVADPAGGGYWLVAADGGVFAYGSTGFHGSMGGTPTQPVVGMAATPDGGGYWLVTDHGAVTAYGDAPSQLGSAPYSLSAPVVAMAAAPNGHGYWLAGADGGIFALGAAPYLGSMGGTPLNQPIVGMAATPDGHGYWLVAADGGIFAFGDAAFYGSMGATPLNQPIVGMAATPDGHGYWLVAADGGTFAFGDAAFYGSTGAAPPSTPVVGMAAVPGGGGYWLATSVKTEPVAGTLPSVQANCASPTAAGVIQPSSILLACGDGNARLTNLRWSSWAATRATASGVFTHNLCVPNCAQGTFVSTAATVTLADPLQTVAGRQFAQITYTYTDPSAPGGQETYTAVIPTTVG